MSKPKILIYTSLIVLGFILLYLFGVKNQKLKSTIQNNGIETIGTIVNRFESVEDGGITTFAIHFDFYVDGELTKSYQRLTGKNEYEKAIVGMKYKVKYLPEKPHKNSIIYINEPQKNEYKNIPKERERILNTYKNAKVFLKKNAQPLDEIKYLIEQ